MKWLHAQLLALHRDQKGVTATEYVVLLVLVACGSLLVLQMIGGWGGDGEDPGALRDFYSTVHEEMSSGKIRGGLSADAD